MDEAEKKLFQEHARRLREGYRNADLRRLRDLRGSDQKRWIPALDGIVREHRCRAEYGENWMVDYYRKLRQVYR